MIVQAQNDSSCCLDFDLRAQDFHNSWTANSSWALNLELELLLQQLKTEKQIAQKYTILTNCKQKH
jgi:hypothetical protein